MATKKTATKAAPAAGGNQGGVLDSSDLNVYLSEGVTALGHNGRRLAHLSKTVVPGQKLIRFKAEDGKDLIAVVGRNKNKDFSVFLSAVPKPEAADK